MQNLILIIFIAAINIFSSCNRKEAENISTKAVSENTATFENILVVSFISKGSGTDKSAINKLKIFLEQYNAAAKKPVTHEVKSWGREGEKDYCIKTDNKEFIDNLKKEMAGIELVRIKENAVCRQ